MAGLITPATGIINLRQFKESFTETLVEQDAADPYENSALFKDESLRQDLARRCSIDDELKYSSQFFLDPTLFSLLRQYRDKNFDEIAHQAKQQAVEANVQAPYIPQRKRQARDVPASLVVDNPSPPSTSPTGEDVEVSLPPLPSLPATTSSNRKRRKTVAQSRLPAILNHIVPRDNDKDKGKESETADKGKGKEKGNRRVSASMPSSAGMSSVGMSSTGVSSFAGGSVTSNVPTTPTLELPFALALPPTSAITTPLEVQTPTGEHDEARSGDDKDQNETEQGGQDRETREEEGEESEEREVVATSLEKKYRDMAALLDQSCLATLKDVNRFVVPPKRRLEVNYLTPTLDFARTLPKFQITEPELLLSIAIYQENRPHSRLQEFQVLGSQPLTALRDAVYCLSDFLTYGAENSTTTVNKHHRKVSSSYFFLEGTFYVDKRAQNEDNLPVEDYSKVIIDWAKENNRFKQPGLSMFESHEMADAMFEDLRVRLNYPYLFVHQGDCEHVMMVRDVRMLGKKDEQNQNAYPKPTFKCKINRNKCRICQVYPAQYVTLNDKESGETPCFFCHNCYVDFHYDERQELLYNDYRVFPYAHD